MSLLPHNHFLSLPKSVSKSGQRPSLWARVSFVAVGVLLVFVFANSAVAAVTEGVIYPGVSVAGKDLSFKTRAQAREELQNLKKDRTFTLSVGDKTFQATGADLGANYDLDSTLDLAYNVGHSTPLPLLSLLQANASGQLGYAYRVNNAKLQSFIAQVVATVGHDPVNATLKVTNGNVEVVPDQDGLRIDEKALSTLLQNSIADGKDQNLKLEPKLMKASVQAKDTGPAKAKAEELMGRSIVLTYEGKQFVPDRTAKGYWLAFMVQNNAAGTPELVTGLSREQIQGYLQSVANQVDIPPKNKKIKILNGVSSVEQEGENGTAINQAAAVESIYNALSNNQNVAVNLTSGPVAFKTETNRSVSLDYGRYIEINLSSQHLWAYQDNQAIFSTPITSGATGAGFPTVSGLFSIYAMERSRYLNGRPYGWNYNVYVDYWMPFHAGYGLHDADWRSSFGGQDYYYGGSHGCVNMPKASAAFLFGWASVGTPVWIHY